MAAHQPGVWGIDIGQCALKALRLEVIDGTVTATAFDYVEHPKILSQPDADPDQLTREALEKFLSRNSLKGDQVAMSVPGQSGLARFVKLPPVEEKKITDIVKFEAKQQIPFALEEVVWDYQKIGSGVVTDGFAMETEIGLFAIKRETVQRALQHFQELEIDVHLVQMAPLALCNFIAYDLLNKDADEEEEEKAGKKQCVVALDIGVESSNMVITDGGRVIWQRPIPIGGNRFTRALTRELKLTFAKAEHLKKNATKSPDLKKILLALKPDLNELVNEVQKSLNFFVNGHRDAQVQYMVGLGSGFKLPGLQKFLNEKLQLEVRKLPQFGRLEGDSVVTAPLFNDNLLTFGIAYGLAVQGLKRGKLRTNLLPQEIQLERTIRAKKPWAAAAAAALLLGVSGLAFGYRLEYDSIASPEIQQAKQAGQKALDKIKAEEAECQKREQQFKQLHQQVRTIIAGQDERMNWPKLNRYINECLPRPNGIAANGKPLPDLRTEKEKFDAEAKYWEQVGGKKALDSYQKRVEYWNQGREDAKQPALSGRAAWDAYRDRQKAKADMSGATASDEELRGLMQVNLTNINPFYTTDLGSYYEKLKGSKNDSDLLGLTDEDLKAAPSGAGWVVELRGYTYHRDINFVLHTLARNLAYHQRHVAEEYKAEVKRLEEEAKRRRAEEKKKAGSPATTEDEGEDEEAEDMAVPRDLEPVAGNISHVVLFTKEDNNPQKGYLLIEDSYAAALVGAGSVKGVDPTSDTSGRWRPVGSKDGTGESILQSGDLNAKTTKGDEPKASDQLRRTEFVIFFVWKEPTPSKKSSEVFPAEKQPAKPGPARKSGPPRKRP